MQSTRLTFTAEGSDKEYRIHLQQEGSGYIVYGENGRRNSTLKKQPKTDAPVSLEEATKLYNSILKKQLSKGYVQDNGSAVKPLATLQVIQTEQVLKVRPVQLLKEAEESEVEALLRDDSKMMEEKKDGERRTLCKENGVVVGGNKKANATDVSSIQVDAMSEYNQIEIDGELVGDIFYAFDLLTLEGVDWTINSAEERIKKLQTLNFGSGIEVVEVAYTYEEKKKMFERIKAMKGEGVVFKTRTATYKAGRDWAAIKYKLYATATVQVASHTKNKRSVQMQVFENGVAVKIGSVTIPPNKEVPAVGAVCEVRYLYAYKGGSLYQPTYLLERRDADASDAVISQLKYKQGQE